MVVRQSAIGFCEVIQHQHYSDLPLNIVNKTLYERNKVIFWDLNIFIVEKEIRNSFHFQINFSRLMTFTTQKMNNGTLIIILNVFF